MSKNEDSEKIYNYIMAVVSSHSGMVFPGPATDGRSMLFAFADPRPTKKACLLDKIKHLLRLDKEEIIIIDEDQQITRGFPRLCRRRDEPDNLKRQ